MAVNPAPSLRDPGDRIGMRLSPSEVAMLAAYAATGDRRQAAHRLGIAFTTGRNALGHAYAKLGVNGAVNAFRRLGWLRAPESRR